MLKKRKYLVKTVVAVCFAVLTAFAVIAQADGDCHSGNCSDKHQRHNFKKLAKKLGLSEAQKSKAKAIFQANKEVIKPFVESLHTEQANLRVLIHSDPVDIPAIRSETTKISGIQTELNINRAKVGAEFRAILTPAQLAALKSLIKNGQHISSTPAEQ